MAKQRARARVACGFTALRARARSASRRRELRRALTFRAAFAAERAAAQHALAMLLLHGWRARQRAAALNEARLLAAGNAIVRTLRVWRAHAIAEGQRRATRTVMRGFLGGRATAAASAPRLQQPRPQPRSELQAVDVRQPERRPERHSQPRPTPQSLSRPAFWQPATPPEDARRAVAVTPGDGRRLPETPLEARRFLAATASGGGAGLVAGGDTYNGGGDSDGHGGGEGAGGGGGGGGSTSWLLQAAAEAMDSPVAPMRHRRPAAANQEPGAAAHRHPRGTLKPPVAPPSARETGWLDELGAGDGGFAVGGDGGGDGDGSGAGADGGDGDGSRRYSSTCGTSQLRGALARWKESPVRQGATAPAGATHGATATPTSRPEKRPTSSLLGRTLQNDLHAALSMGMGGGRRAHQHQLFGGGRHSGAPSPVLAGRRVGTSDVAMLELRTRLSLHVESPSYLALSPARRGMR